MTDYTATRLGGNVNTAIDGNGLAGGIKQLVSTIELAACASGTTIDFGKIPSGARILNISRVYWDDLATSGSPTLDIGLKSYRNNSITADPDALSNGHGVSSADATDGAALAALNAATVGLPAWDLVNGLTADPGGELEVYGSIADAATTATGTVTVELFYFQG
jgi:hypothetical protein